ncbi:hypothetical protein Gogos_008857 [Gossypium gossypioides]|uniref:RNase H type-1 domain-containing protein n=1 Tax=Gossypium gossypioides TaxID=34282 RepID=A0A7J9CDF4_GOSGO|nr:hypothetical protein [Gossypium gossypioides]
MSVVWKGIVENAKDSNLAKWMGKESFHCLIRNVYKGVQKPMVDISDSDMLACVAGKERVGVRKEVVYSEQFVISLQDADIDVVANEDEARFGGVLRNSNRVPRALFSGPIATKDSIATEIEAIIIALDMYLAMGWKGKGSLIIEIGSNEVFSWIENKRLRPWMLQSIFKDIENRMDRVGNISFSKAKKHKNEMASALVLARIKRPGMFKAWW